MNIIVTAGPTREPLDPIRFISNRSTGKMGYALADVCARRNHKVLLISGPVSIVPPRNVRLVMVETADEMFNAVRKSIPWCDVLVMAAAVSDFKAKYIHPGKMKKRDMRDILHLKRNVDILKAVRPRKGKRIYVGFAAETSNIIQEAQKKLKEKGVDLIVANDVTMKNSGFGTDTNRVVFLFANGCIKKLPLMRKTQVAGKIIDWIEDQHGNDK
ncbi:MAG: bifunctional phosphopantothenoylcysteine decarboxylase/phosphopantothenate--cysteine ligase CoaBC [Kiritimatiellae bacterium]|nr:bifunctional phosphopantothenoylcysteine decarboxylase/phosphopantothenate--cysteine ligase CoaBC [Kiritimatiellia bacterium]